MTIMKHINKINKVVLFLSKIKQSYICGIHFDFFPFATVEGSSTIPKIGLEMRVIYEDDLYPNVGKNDARKKLPYGKAIDFSTSEIKYNLGSILDNCLGLLHHKFPEIAENKCSKYPYIANIRRTNDVFHPTIIDFENRQAWQQKGQSSDNGVWHDFDDLKLMINSDPVLFA